MKVLKDPQSGSLGGITAARNRFGQYERQRSMPVQPRTTAQVAARTRLSDVSALWRGLTEAERAAWNSFAGSFTITNSLGQTVNLTGAMAYAKINTVNLLIGDAVNDTPPALPSFDPLNVTALVADSSPQDLALTGTSPAAGTKYMVYAAAPASAGRSFIGNFRYLETFTAATAGEFDILTTYTAKFGAIPAGKKIAVKVVQSQAGFQDAGTVFSAIAA